MIRLLRTPLLTITKTDRMISIICPFYNERDNLMKLLPRLKRVCSNLPDSFEIIMVDDGSTDGSKEFLKSLTEFDHPFTIIERPVNEGLSSALHSGFQASRGETLVTLDADLQNPPEEIPRLLSLMEGVDMVAGIRKQRKDPWLKRITSRAARIIRQSVLKDKIEDVGCSLRVFRRSVLSAFLPYRGMHRFFCVLAERQGYKIRQVPVAHAPREYGVSKYGLINRIWGPLCDLVAVYWIFKRNIAGPTEGK